MSEPPDETLPSSIDSTLDEHRGCMKVVEAVELCLERHPDDVDRWVGDLQRQLELLERTLREHFESEEAGPLFRQTPLRHPRLAVRLKQLEDEHSGLLELLGQTLRSSRELRGGELYELRELNARVQLLVARVRRHEAAENEIIFEANWDEVGVGD